MTVDEAVEQAQRFAKAGAYEVGTPWDELPDTFVAFGIDEFIVALLASDTNAPNPDGLALTVKDLAVARGIIDHRGSWT